MHWQCGPPIEPGGDRGVEHRDARLTARRTTTCDTVATGAEDYYLGRGEAPGRWIGRLAADLGLDGQVDGRRPRARSWPAVTRSAGNRFPGPGIAGSRVSTSRSAHRSRCRCCGDSATATRSRAVRDAHEAAVDAAIGYLEATACWSRRGTNGVDQVRGDGFVAAAFRHRTSRAGDPHLHTHVLVANATRSDDGWGTLDARHLFLHAKTAGYLYQSPAARRAHPPPRRRVDRGPSRLAEIVGIPQTGARSCSRPDATRSRQRWPLRGVTLSRAPRSTPCSTPAKPRTTTSKPPTLHARWTEQAAELGFGPDDSARVARTACPVD